LEDTFKKYLDDSKIKYFWKVS